ncbi:MAG: hypothetical protein JNK48_10850 [Bryobacterales bacterium]|nr:hypothetical protein [Bryobacterales bacterium]
MIVVVADTSPIRYLVRIGEIALLKKLYGVVIVPAVVLDELQAEDGLPVVRAWAGSLPAWVRVRSPAGSLAVGNRISIEARARRLPWLKNSMRRCC